MLAMERMEKAGADLGREARDVWKPMTTLRHRIETKMI
jgi:hypothetical protein